MQVSKAVSKDGLSVDLSSYAEDDCQSPEAQLVPVGSWFPTGARDRFMDHSFQKKKKKLKQQTVLLWMLLFLTFLKWSFLYFFPFATVHYPVSSIWLHYLKCIRISQVSSFPSVTECFYSYCSSVLTRLEELGFYELLQHPPSPPPHCHQNGLWEMSHLGALFQ